MARSYIASVGVPLTAGILFSMLSCGGSTTTPGGGGTISTGSNHAGSAASLETPPGPESADVPDGAGSVTFAVKKLYLGDTDWGGTPDKSGWKNFGYDLDGKASTAASTDLCKPAGSAKASDVYPDGNNGIDNSFGKNILPILSSFIDSSQVSQRIQDGAFTVLLDVQKLGAGDSYSPLLTRLYAGKAIRPAPAWDGTDKWPVIPELLADPADITSSRVQFAKSYLTHNTWVSGTKGDVTLALAISGLTINLTLKNAVVTMVLDPAHTHATKGIIAGAIATGALVDELRAAAGSFSAAYCSGPAIDLVAARITAASDMMEDGSQDPSRTCDAISVGLGFEAEIAELGPVSPPAAPRPRLCDVVDAGATDASSDHMLDGR